MAYQTGTANDLDDLIGIIRAFAEAQGWTIHRHVVGTAIDSELILSSGSTYAVLKARTFTGSFWYYGVSQNMTIEELWIYGATAYDSAAAFDAQPGSTYEKIANHMYGPFAAYHLFGTAQYIHVVVEQSAGEFRHILFGEIDKTATFTGGAYIAATFWDHNYNYIDSPDSGGHQLPFSAGSKNYRMNTEVRADLDGYTWGICYRYDSSKPEVISLPRSGNAMNALLIECAPNEFNGVTPLLPMPVAFERTGGKFSPLGYVPDMRLCNMRNLSPGQEITLGTDTWVCFPMMTKKDPSIRDDRPNSGWYGYAYRKVI